MLLRRLFVLLFMLQSWGYSFASGCPTGAPIATFRLVVLPAEAGSALPVSGIHIVGTGYKLRYEPIKVSEELEKTARVTLILIPATEEPAKHFEVLPPQPVKDPAEWLIPVRLSAVGVIFGSHGIDAKKVASLVEKHPEIVTKVADYAEQSARVEALVQALSKYEEAVPGKSLQSVLQGFSSQYGLQLPAFDEKTASSQQVLKLLHAVAPVVASNDPLPSRSDVVLKAGGLAGSVATAYFGAPMALAIGGAALANTLHSSLFPATTFRSAFAQPAEPAGMNLCAAKAADAKIPARLDYLWVSRIPNEEAPSLSLTENRYIPAGIASTVGISAATAAQLESDGSARDWQLLSTDGKMEIPVKVEPGTSKAALTLNLTQAKVPPGQYQLVAKWDWTPFQVAGVLYVRALGNFSDAVVAPDSEDALIAGAGLVKVQLTGADFEFADSVSLIEAQNSKSPVALPFTLPKGKGKGEQMTMQTEIDTSLLAPGHYVLAIKQTGSASGNVPVTIHPPSPELVQIPVRANVGEPQQTIVLHGKRLERIEKIVSPGADWILPPVPNGASGLTERSATIKLDRSVRQGDRLSAEIAVTDLHKPVKEGDIVSVAGPRPKITRATKSFASPSGPELRDGEVSSGAAMSFSLEVENIDSHPVVAVACRNEYDTRNKLTLTPGDKTGSAELDITGETSLFLSVDPGVVGDIGCQLVAQVAERETGASDVFTLGRVIRLPRIVKFDISDQKLGGSTYAAILTGQDLQLIDKAGWSPAGGEAVQGIPAQVPGSVHEQQLKIAVQWPPPAPKAPLYIWLRGEKQARQTNARY